MPAVDESYFWKQNSDSINVASLNDYIHRTALVNARIAFDGNVDRAITELGHYLREFIIWERNRGIRWAKSDVSPRLELLASRRASETHVYCLYSSDGLGGSIALVLLFHSVLCGLDGSWLGSWGVCFIYGMWFALEALERVGEDYGNSECVRRGCEFLLDKQREDGGWGELFVMQRQSVGRTRNITGGEYRMGTVCVDGCKLSRPGRYRSWNLFVDVETMQKWRVETRGYRRRFQQDLHDQLS